MSLCPDFDVEDSPYFLRLCVDMTLLEDVRTSYALAHMNCLDHNNLTTAHGAVLPDYEVSFLFFVSTREDPGTFLEVQEEGIMCSSVESEYVPLDRHSVHTVRAAYEVSFMTPDEEVTTCDASGVHDVLRDDMIYSEEDCKLACLRTLDCLAIKLMGNGDCRILVRKATEKPFLGLGCAWKENIQYEVQLYANNVISLTEAPWYAARNLNQPIDKVTKMTLNQPSADTNSVQTNTLELKIRNLRLHRYMRVCVKWNTGRQTDSNGAPNILKDVEYRIDGGRVYEKMNVTSMEASVSDGFCLHFLHIRDSVELYFQANHLESKDPITVSVDFMLNVPIPNVDNAYEMKSITTHLGDNLLPCDPNVGSIDCYERTAPVHFLSKGDLQSREVYVADRGEMERQTMTDCTLPCPASLSQQADLIGYMHTVTLQDRGVVNSMDVLTGFQWNATHQSYVCNTYRGFGFGGDVLANRSRFAFEGSGAASYGENTCLVFNTNNGKFVATQCDGFRESVPLVCAKASIIVKDFKLPPLSNAGHSLVKNFYRHPFPDLGITNGRKALTYLLPDLSIDAHEDAMVPTSGNCIAASLPMYQLSNSKIFFRANGWIQVQEVTSRHDPVRVLSYGASIKVFVESGVIWGRYEAYAQNLFISASHVPQDLNSKSSSGGAFTCVVRFADASDAFDEPPLTLHFGKHVICQGAGATMHQYTDWYVLNEPKRFVSSKNCLGPDGCFFGPFASNDNDMHLIDVRYCAHSTDSFLLHLKVVPTKDTLLYLASNPPVISVTVPHGGMYSGSIDRYSFDTEFVATDTDALALRLSRLQKNLYDEYFHNAMSESRGVDHVDMFNAVCGVEGFRALDMDEAPRVSITQMSTITIRRDAATSTLCVGGTCDMKYSNSLFYCSSDSDCAGRPYTTQLEVKQVDPTSISADDVVFITDDYIAAPIVRECSEDKLCCVGNAANGNRFGVYDSYLCAKNEIVSYPYDLSMTEYDLAYCSAGNCTNYNNDEFVECFSSSDACRQGITDAVVYPPESQIFRPSRFDVETCQLFQRFLSVTIEETYERENTQCMEAKAGINRFMENGYGGWYKRFNDYDTDSCACTADWNDKGTSPCFRVKRVVYPAETLGWGRRLDRRTRHRFVLLPPHPVVNYITAGEFSHKHRRTPPGRRRLKRTSSSRNSLNRDSTTESATSSPDSSSVKCKG